MAIVAEVLADGRLEIIGVGSHPSRGMKKGIVVNIDAIVESVKLAVEEAELMSGCQIHSVYTGIAGSHIHSFNSHGFVAVKGGEVTKDDVTRVIEAAKAVSISSEHKILHVLPQEYTLDLQEGIIDPVGMAGMRLEGKVHIVTGAISAAQNIINCVRRCGLDIEDIILQQLASSYAVLTEDEKQLGVCMIDIGGGTTDIAVYIDGTIRHTAVLPVAGDQLTNDIAVAFRTPHQSAEAIKIKHGCAYRAYADKNHIIKLPSVGQNKELHINQFDLAEIIEPRYEELFALVLNELQACGWDGLLGAGIVLTGGSAKMPGVLELAEYIFQSHTRLGLPRHVYGMQDIIANPSYATGIGLLLYGQQMHAATQPKLRVQFNMNNMLGRIKTWFQGNF